MWFKKKRKPAKKIFENGKPRRRKLEEMDFSDLVGILDKEFSFWVRACHANEDGTAVACYTCRRYYPINQIDAGHYMSRKYYGTRWDPRNVKPQCQSENRFDDGVKDIFKERLIQEYGEQEVEKLRAYALYYGQAHPPREELIEQIKKYRAINAGIRKRMRGLML